MKERIELFGNLYENEFYLCGIDGKIYRN